MNKPLVTDFGAGYVHPSRDGRAPVILIGENGERGAWKLTKELKVKCTHCAKIYYGCQSYQLYFAPYDVVSPPGICSQICNSCWEDKYGN
jgi:hypothetical protein